MAVPLLVAGLAAKAIGSFLKGRSQKKKAKEQMAASERERKSTVAGLSLQQTMGEDKRRARLALAQSLLGGVAGTTAGGRVNTNVALDPALLAQLGVERKYNFDPTQAVGADPTKGSTYGFLGGLAGDLGTAALTYARTGGPTPGGIPGGTPPVEYGSGGTGAGFDPFARR